MQRESKVNVLLVDDHPENLLALEAILEGLGQNLVKANSGKEALRCLLHQDFAVILLDVQMPGMDGFETATLIRERERSRHTPIIFLTAFSKSDPLVFKGYSLGAVDYLLKPIEPEILMSKVGVFIDLFEKTTELKLQAMQLRAVNAELKASEERFRSLSACSPVGIFMTDIAGHCTYTNPSCQAIAGFSFEESLGAGWLKSVHPEDRGQVLRDWAATTREARPYSGESRFQHRDGTTRWVHIRSSPMLSDQGKLLGHVGTVEDITERKQAEAARTQVIQEQAARQQAESANRMKDEFLALLSHELRTPLNSMLGWARLLRTRKYDENTTARALETIERNAQLQAQLIEDILDVSRIITGKLRLNLCRVHLAPVVEAVIDMMRPVAEAKTIQLMTTLEQTADLVIGDPDRLQQIVWNLVSNAIKFTSEGGQVEIRLVSGDDWVEVVISDTGQGISADFLPYVFDRFRQSDSSSTRFHGGLGLGLAIVHHLVELHEGTVQAFSPGEGQGSTFTVHLPLSDPMKNQSGSGQTHNGTADLSAEAIDGRAVDPTLLMNPPDLSSLRVLIVDDEADVRNLLSTILRQCGAETIAVSSAAEALEQVQQIKPDLLLSDIGMPGEDGYSLIRKIRALPEDAGGSTLAVALTAYARNSDRMRALEAGFQMHATKPLDPAQLVFAITNLTGRANKVSTS